MTKAISGFGTILLRDNVEIAELTSIGSPSLTLETIDVTNHQSPGNFREVIGSLIDGGSIPITGNFIADDTGQTGLFNDLLNRTVQDFSIHFPHGAAWTFQALVETFSLGEATVDGALTFEASLKVSGKPTLGTSLAANLTDLVISDGIVTLDLIPAFAGEVKEYIVVADTETTIVSVTPTCANADSILVNGNTVLSGSESSDIALGDAGSITKIEIIVKENGKTNNVYVVNLARE